MNKLFLKIENPAVTDLKLTLPEGFDAEYYPSPLPDLYVGDPVSISIRGQNPNGVATLNGKIGSQDWTVKVPLEQASETVGIAKVWARDKIANLERSLIAQSSNNRSQESIDAELLRTALSYCMVSRLSSLVALDVTPSRPVTSRLIQSKLPTAIPHGWDKSQFEFKRQDVLSPKLQKIQPPTARLYKASLSSDIHYLQSPTNSNELAIQSLSCTAIAFVRRGSASGLTKAFSCIEQCLELLHTL